MTIRVMPSEFLRRSYLLSVFKNLAINELPQKRPSVAAEGGSQFTRFKRMLKSENKQITTIQVTPADVFVCAFCCAWPPAIFAQQSTSTKTQLSKALWQKREKAGKRNKYTYFSALRYTKLYKRSLGKHISR